MVAPVSRREAVKSVHVAPHGRVVSGPAVTLGQPGAWPEILLMVRKNKTPIVVINFQLENDII